MFLTAVKHLVDTPLPSSPETCDYCAQPACVEAGAKHACPTHMLLLHCWSASVEAHAVNKEYLS